jgi:hypothetical protein
MRLLKLVRVLRASRIYQRFQARNSLPHAVEAMVKLLVMLIICSHWMACAWIMTASLQSLTEYTWIDSFADSYFCGGECDAQPSRNHLSHNGGDKYFAAIYWSVTTITSVGYGDITPQNPDEMLICTVWLLLGSTIWAYVIGNATAIVSTGNPDMIAHHQTMDSLNRFMADKSFPEELKMRLRRFFRSTKEIAKNKSYQSLVCSLSPKLKCDVSEKTAKWLRSTVSFKNKEVSIEFLVQAALSLRETVYEPKETVHWQNALHCVARGVVSVDGRISPAGAIWVEVSHRRSSFPLRYNYE